MPNAPDNKSTAPSAVVIGIELPGFAKRPVAEQLKQREQLHQRLSGALRSIPQKDRIVLDTSSGVAIALFGMPSLGIAVACALCGTRSADADGIRIRGGLAMGPVQAVPGENGDLQIAGDALDVAERIAALVGSERLVATRAFADALRHDLPECSGALRSLGTVTDSQVREHELFGVQLTHSSILALRNRRSGQAAPILAWLTLPRAAFASLAVALCAYLWSSAAGVDKVSQEVQPVAVARPTQPLELVKIIPPQPLESAEVKVVEMAKLEIAERVSGTEKQPPAPEPVVKPLHGVKPKKAIAVAHAPAPSRPRVPVSEASIEMRDVLRENNAQRGRVLLAIVPWGEVLIDGKSVGISPPLTEMELPAGTHYVEVRNNAAEPLLRRVEVQVNETLKIRHRFADSR